jgi:hypothetical protein
MAGSTGDVASMKTNAIRLFACVASALLACPVAANDISFTAAFSGIYIWNVQIDGGPVMANPPIVLIRGETYNLYVNGLFGFHTWYINTSSGTGSTHAYTGGGLSDNGLLVDTPQDSPVTFTVPQDAPDRLYYNCGIHVSMAGTITIDGVFRNGFEP